MIGFNKEIQLLTMDEIVKTEFGIYNRRHLMQLIRRKMVAKTMVSKKKYNRKKKHRKNYDD